MDKMWEQYKLEWSNKVQKHDWEEEYALDLMDRTWESIKESPVSITEATQYALNFTIVWNIIMAQIINVQNYRRHS